MFPMLSNLTLHLICLHLYFTQNLTASLVIGDFVDHITTSPTSINRKYLKPMHFWFPRQPFILLTLWHRHFCHTDDWCNYVSYVLPNHTLWSLYGLPFQSIGMFTWKPTHSFIHEPMKIQIGYLTQECEEQRPQTLLTLENTLLLLVP